MSGPPRPCSLSALLSQAILLTVAAPGCTLGRCRVILLRLCTPDQPLVARTNLIIFLFTCGFFFCFLLSLVLELIPRVESSQNSWLILTSVQTPSILIAHLTVSPRYRRAPHPRIRRADCTIPFYIRDLSIRGFWYPRGGGWGSWEKASADTKGLLYAVSLRIQRKLPSPN